MWKKFFLNTTDVGKPDKITGSIYCHRLHSKTFCILFLALKYLILKKYFWLQLLSNNNFQNCLSPIVKYVLNTVIVYMYYNIGYLIQKYPLGKNII